MVCLVIKKSLHSVIFSDKDSRIRNRALLSLSTVLSVLDPESVTRKECELFSNFLLGDLTPITQDSKFHLKRNYARVIGSIGLTAYKFAQRNDLENNEIF